MKLPKIRGIYWAREPQWNGIQRLEFTYKRGRLMLNVWEQGPQHEIDWGSTPCFRLKDPLLKRSARAYFASWEADDCMIHCMMHLHGYDLAVSWIGLFPDGKGYREFGEFTQDPEHEVVKQGLHTLDRYKYMWDGNNPHGWKLCTSETPGYVVELQFEHPPGATLEQLHAVAPLIPSGLGLEEPQQPWTDGFENAAVMPINAVLTLEQLATLKQTAMKHKIRLKVLEIPSGELSPMDDRGQEVFDLWLRSPELVKSITRKMLEEGIPVVDRPFPR